MAVPAIIWRNPNAVSQRRLSSQARRDENCSLYVVVRSRGKDTEWEGLPALEVIAGGGATHANRGKKIAQMRG